jgi:tetratricopeptide (TPR) repeat protein
VEELREDVRHHLAGRPVSAQKDTLAYRARKLVERNKLSTALTALVLLSLAGGMVATAVLARARAAEAERAQLRLAEVRQLASAFLFDLDDAIVKVPGTTPARELMVRTAERYLESLASEAGQDRAFLTELATAYEKVGTIQGVRGAANLGRPDQALASFQKALALRQRLAALDPQSRPLRRELVRTHVRIAVLHRELRNRTGARAAAAQALSLAEALLEAQPAEADDMETGGVAQTELGDQRSSESDDQGAAVAYRAAVELRHRAAELQPTPDRQR